MVIWLTGLSGAGKSYIGRRLYDRLKRSNPATALIDGDVIRAIFDQDRDDADYSVAGRRANSRRIRMLCAWLEQQDIDVVCCVLSIFEESHRWNRKHLKEYFEVHISAPMQALIERHPDDLYRRAQRGEISNVVGVDIPYSSPENPDLVIENGFELVDAEEAVDNIVESLRRKFPA